jgi:hypothetical protein
MSKGFNLDLHVAVIGDVKDIFSKLFSNNARIISWSISGHKELFALGPESVDVVNEKTWINIDEDMINMWNVRYGWYMLQFDFFVVTHSPVFAMLYEKYNKPIICVNSCRYDIPYCWNKKPNNLNAALRRMVERKQLTIISNNINDQVYLKERAGIQTPVIPSICQYIGLKHEPSRSQAILFGQTYDFGRRELYPAGDWLVKKPARYEYRDIMKYKCVVHVPYDTSVMTISEHFWNYVPVFFPSKRFYKQCILDKTMCLHHYYGADMNEAQLDKLLDGADYYVFKYINYYDSYEECKQLVENFTDPEREERIKWIEDMKLRVYGAWRNVLPFGRK